MNERTGDDGRRLRDPVASDDYTLCVFDQVTTTPRIALASSAPGAAGRAKVYVKGQGTNLEMPSTLDVIPPVRAQLQAENGQCWETTYATALQDREDVFRAKGGN